MQKISFSVPGIEFIDESVESRLGRFGLSNNRKQVTPEDHYQSVFADAIRSYAAMPEQAGSSFYELLEELPDMRPGDRSDAVMAWRIMEYTRAALMDLRGEDDEEAEMFRPDPSDHPSVDLSAAQDGTQSNTERDADVSRSASADQRASDREIGNIAFGGNKDSVDRTVRQVAAARDEGLRSFTRTLATAVVEKYECDPLIIREKTFVSHGPVGAFQLSTHWLVMNTIDLCLGSDKGMPQFKQHMPRLTPLLEFGLDKREVMGAVSTIARLVTRLRPPRDSGESRA